MSAESVMSLLRRTLQKLSDDPNAIEWQERLSRAKVLMETFKGGAAAERESILAPLLNLLSDDPKWEVRRDVADCLLLIPEDEFPRLVAKLSGDSNAFVRKAAERALDRRRRGQRYRYSQGSRNRCHRRDSRY